MNELKNEVHEFVGDGRDDAVNKACAYFGVDDESALSISGFEDGAVYGLATRTVIVARPKGAAKPAPARSRDDAGRRDDEGRGNSGRGAGRDSSRRRERGRDGRGRESSTSSREDREPRGNRERTPKPETSQADRASQADQVSQADRAEPTAGSSVGSVTGELGEIGQFTLGTIERMGLGPFEISESQDGEMVVLQVKGPAGEMLSAGHGRTVDALQLLVNQVSARFGPDRQRVVIDVEGDADAREEFLGKLADRVAKRALQTGRAVALDPMNGRDRRLIHVALRDREDVATMSEGEGRYRQVVVVPENSDEFEEARAKSERSGNNN